MTVCKQRFEHSLSGYVRYTSSHNYYYSVIMHSFQKIVSDFATFHLSSYVHFKTLIGFALRVSRTKGYSFKSGTSFVELAANGRN